MQAVTYSDFRTHMKEYCDQAAKEDDIVIITRKKGNGNGVYMPLEVFNRMKEELESYKETAYLLSSEANRKNILESIKEHKNGKIVKKSIDELEGIDFD